MCCGMAQYAGRGALTWSDGQNEGTRKSTKASASNATARSCRGIAWRIGGQVQKKFMQNDDGKRMNIPMYPANVHSHCGMLKLFPTPVSCSVTCIAHIKPHVAKIEKKNAAAIPVVYTPHATLATKNPRTDGGGQAARAYSPTSATVVSSAGCARKDAARRPNNIDKSAKGALLYPSTLPDKRMSRPL